MVRLWPLAMESFQSVWEPRHWLVGVVWAAFMVYSEGYRGFHRAFSPRFAARLKHLYDHPRPVRVALAPFFAMCLFGATRRRMIAAWILVVGIVSLVMMVRHLAQPWRGIVDAGVVLGLAVGAVSTVAFLYRAFRDPGFSVPPELPLTGAASSA